MYCKKCGQQISETAKFCPRCGTEIKRKDSFLQNIRCDNCGSPMEYSKAEDGSIVFSCSNCGSKKTMIVNSPSSIEEDDTAKDLEMSSKDSGAYEEDIDIIGFANNGSLNPDKEAVEEVPKVEKSVNTTSEKVRVSSEPKKTISSKGILSNSTKKKKTNLIIRNIILVILFVVLGCCVYSYLKSDMLRFAISMIQTFLLIGALLNHGGYLRKEKWYLFILLTTLSLVLFYPFIKAGNAVSPSDEKNSSYVWPDTELGSIIPNPTIKNGEILWSYEDSFYINFEEVKESDFTQYVNLCKAKGFNVDAHETSNSFSAYNADGYNVDVFYWKSLEEITISADIPEKLKENYWPKTGLAENLPMPDSRFGLVKNDTSESLVIYIGGNKEDVDPYAEKCAEQGFSINYSRDGDSYYIAENEQGYELIIEYIGGGIIQIRLDAPEENEESENDEIVTDTTDNSQSDLEGEDNSISREVTSSSSNELVRFYFDLDFVPNLIFSTYDVDFYLDNEKVKTIPHGQDYSQLFELTPGKHELLLCKSGNRTVKGEAEITLSKDTTIQAKIFVYSDEILFNKFEEIDGIIGASIQVPNVETMPLSQAVNVLKDAGLNNIRYVDKNNNSIVLVSTWTVEKQSVGSGESIDKNDELLLTCINSDEYAGGLFNNHSLSEVSNISAANKYDSTNYYTLAGDQINEQVSKFSEDEKKNWQIKKTVDNSSSTAKKADLYIVYTGEVQMPNLIGVGLEEAIQILKDNKLYNFDYGTADESMIWVRSNWQVSAQNVTSGTAINGDTKITLVCERINSTSGNQNRVSSDSPKPRETNNESVSFSTNDKTTYKNGNSGIYAYSRDGSYALYYIIDFDEGYVYFFSDGESTCERVKIVQGDLNSVCIITYHDGNDVWSYGLHFKYKGFPDHLIVQEESGFEWDYYPTNLDKALEIRDTKEIIDY